MHLLLNSKYRIGWIGLFWLFLAVLLTTKASLGQFREYGFSNWYQNFFYQASGALVWFAFTPLIVAYFKRFNLSESPGAKFILAHMALSIPLALTHRAFALAVDFGLRALLDMGFFGSMNLIDVLLTFKIVILESAVNSFITYWLIIGVLMAGAYYRKYKQGELKREEKPVFLKQLKVKVGDDYKLISMAEVICFEASGNYIKLFTAEGQYRIRQTMRSLEPQLPEPFVRVHRSAIVNLDFLDSFQHLYQGEYLLKLRHGKQLTTTRAYRENLQVLLTGN